MTYYKTRRQYPGTLRGSLWCLEGWPPCEFEKQLYQIRVGPGNPPSYRAWVMFLDESTDAYWVYAFKKGKGRQPEDMDRGRELAKRHWEKIRRGTNG